MEREAGAGEPGDAVVAREPTTLDPVVAREPRTADLPPAPASAAPAGAAPAPHRPVGVGAIVGATIDTYAAALPRILAVSIPYAIVVAAVPTEAPWPLLTGLAWAAAAAYVIRVAGNELRGEPRPAGDALAAGGARFLPLLAWSLLVGLVLGGLAVVTGIAVAAAGAVAVGGGPVALVAGLLAVVIAIAVTAGGLALLARWSVAPPAIVLDREGPLSGSRRSADLVRGRTAAVAVLLLLGALTSTIPAAGALLPFAVAEVGEVVAIAVTAILLATTFPLLPVGATVLYARLDGTAVRMRRPSPARAAVLSAAVAASLALGLAFGVLGGVGMYDELGQIAAQRGTVTFGSNGTECTIEDACTTFAVGDEIYVVATLRREVSAGTTVDVRVLLDGELIDEGSNVFADDADCVYGSTQTGSLKTGRYTIEYAAGGEVLASGGFELVAP